MKIIEELKKRSEGPFDDDDVKIELKLYNLADDLTKKAISHLKRVKEVLPEFDLHDSTHSEKVLSNQELLLGEKKIQELSAYELFLIYLSAYFHDCAMAPSDWELEVMKLTEGTAEFNIIADSLCNDLKTPVKISEAENFIRTKKEKIYESFDSDVKEWMFSPKTEKELIHYLAELLVEYQNYRNGFSDQIRKISAMDDFQELSDFIRTDYIRATHHVRIETYIKYLQPIFSNAFQQRAWGKQLVNDLAKICRSHGEDVIYIDSLSSNTQYYGSGSTNLQFVAMMLRLGDIIHFSFDRAPLELRASRIFKSEYSFLQWAIKNNGVNYSIEDGLVSFRAYCEQPEPYFKLHQYIDWIELEIQNYFRFERHWEKKYIDNLQDKVNRENIHNDEDSFLPMRGLSFSLNQKRIIDLLMGVGLYKDEYACLRELYQNALDACRCMISQNKILSRHTKGIIEFGLEREDDKTYLYCLDNGTGMSKHIIETYLLKIGNSYYKSSDFFKHQAKWGGTFTPTSQFGIGILSCFMLGHKIEITTKTKDGDYISCAIDGPNENFYYKKTSGIEKEKILECGTIVKILLDDPIDKTIHTQKIEKLGILLMERPTYFPDKYAEYKDMYQNWDDHLYNKINSFVGIVPNEIEVLIKLDNNTKLQIESDPVNLDENKYGLDREDTDLIDFLVNQRSHKYKYSEIKDFSVCYIIVIPHKSIQYKTALYLPKPGLANMDTGMLHYLLSEISSGLCIDGIYITEARLSNIPHHFTRSLLYWGILNFKGENRPQVSVDRTSILNYNDEHETIVAELVELLLKKVIVLANEHIEKYKIENNSNEFNLIWEFLFDKFDFAEILFINELLSTDYGGILWKGISDAVNENISIKDFLLKEEVKLPDYNFSKFDNLTQKFIIFKSLIAKEVIVSGNTLILKDEDLYRSSILKTIDSIDERDLVIFTENCGNTFDNYDLISNFGHIIPQYLFNKLNGSNADLDFNNAKWLGRSNGLITDFFTQDPLFVHEQFGLYYYFDFGYGKDENFVYDFGRKRDKYDLSELNYELEMQKLKKRYVISVYISPRDLNEAESAKLKRLESKDKSYYKGVTEGWSILVTGMDVFNTIIHPGKCTRSELVAKIPDEFWVIYEEYEFMFPDDSPMIKM